MRSIAFLDTVGAVGKSLLVYHLAFMFRELGHSVLVADFDPQARLTAMFLDDDRLEELWLDGPDRAGTVFDCLAPLMQGRGDIGKVGLELIDDGIHFIAGDMALSTLEERFSSNWHLCNDGDETALRTVSSLHALVEKASEETEPAIALFDLGANLGAINRSALLAADSVILLLSPDVPSLRGLRYFGPTLQAWRRGWAERLTKRVHSDLILPEGRMEPAGYVVLQHSLRWDRPIKPYRTWMDRIPATYAASVLGKPENKAYDSETDPHKIAHIKHYRSLVSMAMEARKPMFYLKPADGAIGAHQEAVSACYKDFAFLAKAILERLGLLQTAEYP